MTPTGRIYGDSLYDLAKEENKEADILEQMDGVADLLRQYPEYLRLLSLPSIPKAERCGLIDQAFGGRIDGYLLNFLKILCEKGILSELSCCARQMRTRYHRDRGIVEAVATAAVSLSDSQRAALKKRLEDVTGRSVCLECRVDSGVLGGLRLDMEGVRLDGTVQSRLKDLRSEIAEIVV